MRQKEKKYLKQYTNHSKNTTRQKERYVKRKEGNFFLIYDNKRKEYLRKEFYAPGGGEIGCNIFLRKLKEKSILAKDKNNSDD